MAKQQTEKIITIEARCVHMDDYKRLIFDLTKEDYNRLNKKQTAAGLKPEDKNPTWETTKTDEYRMRVNLDRFQKVDYKIYLNMVGKRYKVVLCGKLYDSTEYGRGYTWTPRRFKRLYEIYQGGGENHDEPAFTPSKPSV